MPPAIDVSQRKVHRYHHAEERTGSRGKLDAVGGPYELLRISSKVSSSAHLEYHALILRQLHTRRIMRTGFQQLLAFSADESMDIDDILVEAHRLLEGLEDESGVADHLRSIDRLMDDTLAEVEQRMEHGATALRVSLRVLTLWTTLRRAGSAAT